MIDPDPTYILVHDVGTTANKACLYRVSETLELVTSHVVEYPVYILPDGGAEQKVDEWWEAIRKSTRQVLQETGITPTAIKGMAFCAQMTAFIPVDKNGTALRNPMNYLDGRSTAQIERYLYTGLLRVNRMNLFKLLNWVRLTGGGAASAKDAIWKYLWVRDHEPEIFSAMYKWLDVKDYLVLRCTGEFTMGYDTANVTFVYDTRPGKLGWSETLCRTYEVDMDHLPRVVGSTEKVGGLLPDPAAELGLPEGIPVFGGGGDLSMISLGSGGFDVNDTHIYIGTSGWVVANLDQRKTDIFSLVGGVMGAIPGRYNYIAEQETSGTCLQWVRDHLAQDTIGIYLQEEKVSKDVEKEERSLYDLLNDVVADTEPGSRGVIFTPWMHGNRSPFEDPYVRGMFFNIGLETGKRHLVRSVLEGDAYHKRWMLEAVEKNVLRQETLRFVGGGAQSEQWAQILADVTGRNIEVVTQPQNAGAMGAALTCVVGLGLSDWEKASKMVRLKKQYSPLPENLGVYERQYEIFKQLYHQNHKLYKSLNG
jgi:xylulokinase